MTGSALALTPRDRRLLSEVQRCGALTREQIIRLKFFTSKTRANERLKRLVAGRYLTVRPQPLLAGGPRFVYLPGRLLGLPHRWQERSDLFLAHQLGIVDIRLAFEAHTRVTRWLSDRELTTLKLGLVPDGYLEYEADGLTYSAFVEYDRGTETLGRIEQKVREYADLAFSGRFERALGRAYFRMLLVTDTDGRLATLSGAVSHVTTKIVRLASLPDLIRDGPLRPIWRQPAGTVLQSLIER